MTYFNKKIVLFFVLAFSIASKNAFSASAMPEVSVYLKSSGVVDVSSKSCGSACRFFSFQPKQKQHQTGIIFYPGAFISSAAYAPLAFHLAEQGYTVAIPKFIFNFALNDANRAGKVSGQFPDITRWILMGHSLGGVAASRFLAQQANNPQWVGIVYLASYPGAKIHFESQTIKALSLYGALDSVLDREKYSAAKVRLPEDTLYQEISGGNHAQMGYYGEQKGDNPASISREAQQAVVLGAVLNFLQQWPDAQTGQQND